MGVEICLTIIIGACLQVKQMLERRARAAPRRREKGKRTEERCGQVTAKKE